MSRAFALGATAIYDLPPRGRDPNIVPRQLRVGLGVEFVARLERGNALVGERLAGHFGSSFANGWLTKNRL